MKRILIWKNGEFVISKARLEPKGAYQHNGFTRKWVP